MGTAENKAVSRRFFDEVMNQRNLDVLDQIVAPDVVDHAALPGQAPGIDGYRDVYAAIFAAFSDLHYDVLTMIAENDLVVTQFRATGTHDGSFFDAEPTGRQGTVTAITIDRIHDGRIVESWTEADTLAFATLIGQVPATV